MCLRLKNVKPVGFRGTGHMTISTNPVQNRQPGRELRIDQVAQIQPFGHSG